MGSIDDDEWTREWWKFVEASPVFMPLVCVAMLVEIVLLYEKALYEDISEAGTVNEINTHTHRIREMN